MTEIARAPCDKAHCAHIWSRACTKRSFCPHTCSENLASCTCLTDRHGLASGCKQRHSCFDQPKCRASKQSANSTSSTSIEPNINFLKQAKIDIFPLRIGEILIAPDHTHQHLVSYFPLCKTPDNDLLNN